MGQGPAEQPAVPTQLGDEQAELLSVQKQPPLAGLEHPLELGGS